MAGRTFTAPRLDSRFFGHPVGLATLFTTELWERFSYYGMRAILVLYLAAPTDEGGLGMSGTEAVAIYGIYSAMVYLLAVPGGWIADRIWGARRAVLIGAWIIAAGHFVMAIPLNWSIWPGLILVAMGTGLLKPNISAMVGMLYDEDTDEGVRRDSGFSLYYMGINIGGFIAPFVCGFLGEGIGWHLGFGAAGVGMAIAVLVYVGTARRTLGPIGTQAPDPAAKQLVRKIVTFVGVILGIYGTVLAVLFVLGLYDSNIVIITLTLVVFATPVGYFGYIFSRGTMSPLENNRMKAYIWIFIGAVMFWMIFDQAGSMLNLFAENNTARYIGDYEFPASWLQSVDPLGIIIMAPVFAWIWIKLGKRAPSLPAKFALSVLLIGLSFVVMGWLGHLSETSLVAWEYLFMVLIIQVIAELLLSPTGLSASTLLAPRGMESQVLSLWFLATAVGDALGGQLGRLQPTLGDAGYFTLLGVAAIVLSIILTTQIKRLRRLMGGVH